MNKYLALVIQLLALLLPTTLITQSEAPTGSLSAVNPDEVVMMGTRTDYLLKDAPMQTEIINTKTLQSYGSAVLTEILSGLIPPVDFNHSDMGTAMQMDRLEDRYILILVDGKRLMSDLGRQTSLDMVDLARIECVEAVKGVSSALYGNSAITGVINIITKRSRNNLSIDNSTRVTSYGVINQSNTFQYKVGD